MNFRAEPLRTGFLAQNMSPEPEQNAARRHLKPSQRAMIAARLANMPRGGYRKNIKPSVEGLISVAAAAKITGVHEDSANHARRSPER
jgi:hypothetical protein